MNRILFFLILISGTLFMRGSDSNDTSGSLTLKLTGCDQDTITRNQLLYNGRVWRNTYTGVKGDPYLFSKEFLKGSVTINGKNFDNVKLLYEIHKDEILTVSGRNIIILLNKEMVNSFNIEYNNRSYRFVNSENAPVSLPVGYSNALYEGATGVYVKYRKVIDPRAIENRYDAFRQVHRIYVIRDSVPMPVGNPGQFFNLFSREDTRLLKLYLKKEKIRLSMKEPDSFAAVARYYDLMKGQGE